MGDFLLCGKQFSSVAFLNFSLTIFQDSFASEQFLLSSFGVTEDVAELSNVAFEDNNLLKTVGSIDRPSLFFDQEMNLSLELLYPLWYI